MNKLEKPQKTAVFDESCPLCVRHQTTMQHYEDIYVWVTDCKSCKCPMIVWKNHKNYLEPKELSYVWEIAKKLFGNEALECMDTNMRQLPEHWHCHLRGLK